MGRMKILAISVATGLSLSANSAAETVVLAGQLLDVRAGKLRPDRALIIGEAEEAGILPESLEKERRTGKRQRENFQEAHEAGVAIAFGTDAGVYPHGQNARQLSRMVEFGMTPAEAIRAATAVAADLLGLGAEVGRLAPGYHADIIAVADDPLADIAVLEAVPVVIKAGRVTKDTRAAD